MNFHHASKTMNTLTRLRQQQQQQQQQSYHITPENSDDEDGGATIRNNHDSKKIKSTVVTTSPKDQVEQQIDLYTPLTPDEADEDQLAEFFNALDVDVSFGECLTPALLLNIDNEQKNSSDITTSKQHASKRRRVSSGGDSLSSSSSEETDDRNETELGLQRKRSRFGTVSDGNITPIE